MGHLEVQQPVPPPRPCSRPFVRVLKWAACVALLLFLSAAYDPQSFSSNVSLLSDFTTSAWEIRFGSKACQPVPPNIFAYNPPRPSNDLIIKASKDLDKYLSDRVSKPDIDSIAVSIVTPAGALFEEGYGVLRANETETEEALPVDRDSIYRIASISKMFTVLETLILRERGALNWDDPVEKFLPEFKPPAFGWSSHLNGVASVMDEKPRISLRQLASHLAGIGRDYPPTETDEWPVPEIPRKCTLLNTPNISRFAPMPTYETIMKAVAKYPLVNIPYEYPVYSNTGMDLLGSANIAANKLSSSDPSTEPQTHRELLKRDVFDPLQMNSSFFRVPGDRKLRDQIAVPSKAAEWADISLEDFSDPAGGQYSSLGDLSTIMQTFLSPTGRGGVISANVVREWLRPLYSFSSVSEEVGAPWEIVPSLSDAKAYTKGGNLPGYHSKFAIIPEYSIGIVLLITGEYSDSGTILKEVAKRFVPTIQKLHNAEIERRYAGTWVNGEDSAEVELKKGALMLKKLVIGGVDVLKTVYDSLSVLSVEASDGTHQMGGTPPVALWSTGRTGEFRLAFGRPNLNKMRNVGCMPYWISLDLPLHSRGAPVDLVYWRRGVLTYPSAGVILGRKR